MAVNNSNRDTERLEFKRPFWSGWKIRLVGCVVVLAMTVAALKAESLKTPYIAGVWFAFAWYMLIDSLRRDFRQLQKGGGRFVVDDDRIRSFRFGREVSLSWSEITKVDYGAAHLRLASPTTRVSIPTNLPGYDRLHRFLYARIPSAALQPAHQLPIRVRYEVTSSIIGGTLLLLFVLLVGHGMLAPSDYELSVSFLIVVPVVGLFVWIACMGVYRALTTFEFQQDRIIVHTPFKKREYATAGLLDMHLESKSEQDTTTVLKLILSGGEYVTVRDGNPSAGELYQILKPYYLPSRQEISPMEDRLTLGP